MTRSLPPWVPNTWAHTSRRTGWSTGSRFRVTASNTGPPVRWSQLKWRTIDACDVIEHIASRTASSQPVEPGFSTPRAVSMCTGASSPEPGSSRKSTVAPSSTSPGWHSNPASDVRSQRNDPSPVASR